MAVQKVMEDGGITVTADMLTEKFNKRANPVLTCHCVPEKWQLESCILEFDIHLKKNSENVPEQVTSVCQGPGPNTKAAPGRSLRALG